MTNSIIDQKKTKVLKIAVKRGNNQDRALQTINEAFNSHLLDFFMKKTPAYCWNFIVTTF